MHPDAILAPVFATILLTFAVWTYMYVVRIRFLNSSDVDADDLRVPGRLAAISPPSVSNPSDNLKNLFEIPVLFYALAWILHTTGQVDALHLAAAWVFVIFRALHSAVHCTFNKVMLRFTLYLVSTLAVWLIAARAALGALGG